MRVNKAELDGFATDSILAALQSRELYQKIIPANTDHDAEHGAVRDKLANLRAQHDELAASVASGDLSPMFAVKAEPAILEASRKPRDENRSFCLRACSRS